MSEEIAEPEVAIATPTTATTVGTVPAQQQVAHAEPFSPGIITLLGIIIIIIIVFVYRNRLKEKLTQITTTSKYGAEFCSPNESQITSIGTGYVANFISAGTANRAGATLTNKRIYYSGKNFEFNGRGRLSSTNEQKIVNVRDVTGTGYKLYNPLYLFITGIIALIAGFLLTTSAGGNFEDPRFAIGVGVAVGGVVALFNYQNKRTTLLLVEYAGGNIAFDVRWIQAHEQDDFIRNIHLAKDKLYSMSAVEQGFVDDVDEIPAL
ncbi:MAG: hypothetical protein FWF79_04095 [Defluviitaleaceae bacterium]|nr:hypothetical protein [Defluviitaleaceae bacterium]